MMRGCMLPSKSLRLLRRPLHDWCQHLGASTGQYDLTLHCKACWLLGLATCSCGNPDLICAKGAQASNMMHLVKHCEQETTACRTQATASSMCKFPFQGHVLTCNFHACGQLRFKSTPANEFIPSEGAAHVTYQLQGTPCLTRTRFILDSGKLLKSNSKMAHHHPEPPQC